jgi:Thioesterase-like superfamily
MAKAPCDLARNGTQMRPAPGSLSLPLMTDAIYERRDGFVHATGFARGPWDPNAQHGGAPAAIIMRALEQLEEADHSLQLARVTYELIRPVPLGDLHVSAAVVRPGRKVQLLEASLATLDGTEVVKARALLVARAPVSTSEPTDLPPADGPENLTEDTIFSGGRQMYVNGGIEVRMARGHFYTQGPAFAWFRLRLPLVAGEDASPLQRLVAAADFPNGISSELSWDEYVFINPDLTVYLERAPRGEWIGLDAQTRVVENGVGLAQAVLYDAEGRVGRSLQSLYVAHR